MTAKAVHIENLTDGSILAKDIYMNSSVLYRSGTYVTSELAADLFEKRVQDVVIRDEPAPAYRGRYTQDLTPHQRRTLTDRFQNDMALLADELRCGRILHSESSYRWLHSMYLRFFANPAVLLLMDSLKQWDPLCYIHSIDVFVFCSLYSRRSSLKFPEGFILGCLLHDIGKLYTPRSILLKKGKLTEREFDQIKQHTLDGYNMLVRLGFPQETCRIVRSHHERLNGSGYPDRLALSEKDNDLNFMMVTDVYSALTLHRPYHEPMKATMALQIILSDCVRRHLFSLSTCYSFINFLHIFPPATRVMLTTGETGTIIANPEGSDILPKIKLDQKKGSIQLPKNLSVTVKDVVGWDSTMTDALARQTWDNFISCLINGDARAAVGYFNVLSDGKRIENIFTDLLEKSVLEIRSGVAAHRYYPSDAMIASSTMLTLMDWNMKRAARDVKTEEAAIIANLGAGGEIVPMKMVSDLLMINGWRTFFLGFLTDTSMITELIIRKKARYLALPLSDQSHLFTVTRIMKQLRQSCPELTVFVHGSHAGLVSSLTGSRSHILTSTNMSEFIANLKCCFPSESAGDKS